MDIEPLVDVDKSEFPTKRVADHEVYLSFSSDQAALWFREWLAENWEDFELYMRNENT